MRIFYECTLLERGPGYPIDLVAVGLVRDDGATYHATVMNEDGTAEDPEAKPRGQIAAEVAAFILEHPQPELWACCGAYDYVALRQLFGAMEDAPPGFPGFPCELMQEIAMAGYDAGDLPELGLPSPSALERARRFRDVASHLDDLPVIGGASRD